MTAIAEMTIATRHCEPTLVKSYKTSTDAATCLARSQDATPSHNTHVILLQASCVGSMCMLPKHYCKCCQNKNCLYVLYRGPHACHQWVLTPVHGSTTFCHTRLDDQSALQMHIAEAYLWEACQCDRELVQPRYSRDHQVSYIDEG